MERVTYVSSACRRRQWHPTTTIARSLIHSGGSAKEAVRVRRWMTSARRESDFLPQHLGGVGCQRLLGPHAIGDAVTVVGKSVRRTRQRQREVDGRNGRRPDPPTPSV